VDTEEAFQGAWWGACLKEDLDKVAVDILAEGSPGEDRVEVVVDLGTLGEASSFEVDIVAGIGEEAASSSSIAASFEESCPTGFLREEHHKQEAT